MMRRAAWSVAAAIGLVPGSAYAASWSLEIGGGLESSGGELQNQPFGLLSLTRTLGDFHIRGGASISGGGGEAPTGPGLSPTRTRQLSIGGGWSTGSLLIDLQASAGKRDFDPLVRQRGGRVLSLESDGDLVTIGGSASWDGPLGQSWRAGPFAALSYSEIDTVRLFTVPSGMTMSEARTEKGITGTAGFAASRHFGRASAGLSLAAATTSNRGSVNRQVGIGSAQSAPQILDGVSDGDTWIEAGLSGSVPLGRSIALDASLVRTFGFAPFETTSLSAGLRFTF